MVHESVEPVAEQVVHVTKTLPQRCISHCTVEQFVDVAVPLTAEKVVQDPVHHPAQEVSTIVHEPAEQIGKLAVDATSLIGNSIESKKLHTDDIATEELQDCGPRPGRPPGHLMNGDTAQEDDNSWLGRPLDTC